MMPRSDPTGDTGDEPGTTGDASPARTYRGHRGHRGYRRPRFPGPRLGGLDVPTGDASTHPFDANLKADNAATIPHVMSDAATTHIDNLEAARTDAVQWLRTTPRPVHLELDVDQAGATTLATIEQSIAAHPSNGPGYHNPGTSNGAA